MSELRKGGYVIYFRHTLTEQTAAPDGGADLQRCETQRNLSQEGRAQAAAIGKAIKTLGIPVGVVRASPFCRTRETARLAFGPHLVEPDLAFVIAMEAPEVRRLAAALKRMLATAPRPGTNTVLVSHSANLREAAAVFARPEGAAYVFRPLPNDGFELVAKFHPEDWVALASARPSSRQH